MIAEITKRQIGIYERGRTKMTEREKMLAGQLYDCGDKELLAQWHRAKDLIRIYTIIIWTQPMQKKNNVF